MGTPEVQFVSDPLFSHKPWRSGQEHLELLPDSNGGLLRLHPWSPLNRILHYGDSRNARFSGPQRYLKPSWAGPLHNGNTRDSIDPC